MARIINGGTKHYQQKLLFPELTASTSGLNGTFSPNHKVSVHRWYPYLEGFSTDFVQGIVNEFGSANCRIYDPFAGTGTTVTTAAFTHCLPFYSEINPVMRLIIECKTNGLRQVARRKKDISSYFRRLSQYAASHLPSQEESLREQSVAFNNRPFFKDARLVEVIAIKRAVEACRSPSPEFKNFARLALASIAVSSSEMKRAADLRYRTPSEAHKPDFSPITAFQDKLAQIAEDLEESFSEIPATTCLSHSALDEPRIRDAIDLVITSPPYVNGTNYFRNTKIELWLTGFLKTESELGNYCDQAVAAGINNISKRGRMPTVIDSVERVAKELDEVAYDKRIPELIRRYFSDAQIWLSNSFALLRSDGVAVVDIGDSRFAGVHVPADDLLSEIADRVGFQLVQSRLVRTRKSKDGTALKQVLLVLKKPRQKGRAKASPKKLAKADSFLASAVTFGNELPHLHAPYNSRNWGHGLHSLCSYQGKLKPAIAHFLVSRFTQPGECVLDPLSGSGGVPLEVFLQGEERIAIGNDLQELAFQLTQAKVAWGRSEDAVEVMENLLHYVSEYSPGEDPEQYNDFGFNGKLPDYFHADTYKEVLAARRYMKDNPTSSWETAVIYSCLLHILHGNRPYALSRRSHPVTPFKPTGPNEYRQLARRLRDKVTRTLSLSVPSEFRNGTAHLGDFRSLPYNNEIDVIITSPPFAASTRFFSTNWMRLWFAGWEPTDFNEKISSFLERQQKKNLDVYEDFFSCCAKWLRPNGKLILHLGKTAKVDMAAELCERIGDEFEFVYRCEEDVAGRESFGLSDQGATTSHQYLFLRRR